MRQFKHSDEEQKLNKVLKMNQDQSKILLDDPEMAKTRDFADQSIESSLALLKSLGKDDTVAELESRMQNKNTPRKLDHRPQLEDWDEIVQEAECYTPGIVNLEDIMSENEIDAAFQELDEINDKFSKKTSIINKTDLSFLAVATALKVTKSLIFPYVAQNFHYGEGFDPAERLAHNDKSIESAHKKANDNFRDKKLQKHDTGHWINLLYQTPPYDITTGSSALGINMGGRYHRMYTLGHDPILGWIFGTMNILTDVITLNTFSSYRVIREPKMRITGEIVPIGSMIYESYKWVEDDYLNLPAAIFAQAQHLKSDEFTKIGLPVPLLSSINENFSSNLYKNNYDALCFATHAGKRLHSNGLNALAPVQQVFDRNNLLGTVLRNTGLDNSHSHVLDSVTVEGPVLAERTQRIKPHLRVANSGYHLALAVLIVGNAEGVAADHHAVAGTKALRHPLRVVHHNLKSHIGLAVVGVCLFREEVDIKFRRRQHFRQKQGVGLELFQLRVIPTLGHGGKPLTGHQLTDTVGQGALLGVDGRFRRELLLIPGGGCAYQPPMGRRSGQNSVFVRHTRYLLAA